MAPPGDDPQVLLRVECAPGQGGEDTPRAFFLGDRRIAVTEALDQATAAACTSCGATWSPASGN